MQATKVNLDIWCKMEQKLTFLQNNRLCNKNNRLHVQTLLTYRKIENWKKMKKIEKIEKISIRITDCTLKLGWHMRNTFWKINLAIYEKYILKDESCNIWEIHFKRLILQYMRNTCPQILEIYLTMLEKYILKDENMKKKNTLQDLEIHLANYENCMLRDDKILILQYIIKCTINYILQYMRNTFCNIWEIHLARYDEMLKVLIWDGFQVKTRVNTFIFFIFLYFRWNAKSFNQDGFSGGNEGEHLSRYDEMPKVLIRKF